MQMLISHRRSAYIDDGDLEYAAGLFEIQRDKTENVIDRTAWDAASKLLRIMNEYDIKSVDDLMVLFRRYEFGETSNQMVKEN